MINNNYIPAFWFSSNNVGDNLNHFIIKKLSGKPVVHTGTHEPHYIVCGSILSSSTSNTIAWGPGFMHEEFQFVPESAKVIAVRGRLTANRIEQEVEAIGDPALLMPMLYEPPAGKKHMFALVPHWEDYKWCIKNFPDIHIVDPFQPVKEFVDDIVSCEKVLCSSLHGLIIADAYKIPNAWIQFPCCTQPAFKYRDYYSSTKFPDIAPIQQVDFAYAFVKDYAFDKQQLLNSCPFLKNGPDTK